MRIEDVAFTVTTWANVAPVEYPGKTGVAIWRTVEAGNLRVRQVEYSAGYEADHWCSRGHTLLVLSGRLETHLKDGRVFNLDAGMSYQVAEGAEPHLSKSATGATLFIVD